jgi:hypothetical protein
MPVIPIDIMQPLPISQGETQIQPQGLVIVDGPHRLLGTSVCPAEPYSVRVTPTVAPARDAGSSLGNWLEALVITA